MLQLIRFGSSAFLLALRISSDFFAITQVGQGVASGYLSCTAHAVGCIALLIEAPSPRPKVLPKVSARAEHIQIWPFVTRVP